MHRSIGWDETLDAPTGVVTSLTGAASGLLQDDRYTWDAAEDLIEVADHAGNPVNPTLGPLKRCNVVDGLGRLTHAYTVVLGHDCGAAQCD